MGESNRKNTEGERERERLGESNRKNTERERERLGESNRKNTEGGEGGREKERKLPVGGPVGIQDGCGG